MLDKKKNMKGLTSYVDLLELSLRKATEALGRTDNVFYVLKRINDIWFLQERFIYPLIGASPVYSYKYLIARKDSLTPLDLEFSRPKSRYSLRMKEKNKISNRM